MNNRNARTSPFDALRIGLMQAVEFEKGTGTARAVSYSAETAEKSEIRNFIDEGMRDVRRGAICDFNEAFNRLESRYQEKELIAEYLTKLDESNTQIERGETVRLTPEQLAAL